MKWLKDEMRACEKMIEISNIIFGSIFFTTLIGIMIYCVAAI